jgi:hypothetical protein
MILFIDVLTLTFITSIVTVLYANICQVQENPIY